MSWTVERLGAPMEVNVEAGDNERHGSYSPEVNLMLEGLMCQPPYLFGSETLGEGGSLG
jgi:hypothetical protein